LLEGGQWGAGRLVVRAEGKFNVIEMIEFNPMQSGKVRLEQLIKARKQFSTQEWIYLLIRAMGYEPFAYSHAQQNNLILRLLPLIQNNLNLMELAPKGTGKSFIYSNLSSQGNLYIGAQTGFHFQTNPTNVDFLVNFNNNFEEKKSFKLGGGFRGGILMGFLISPNFQLD
jgi:uncharacterized protein (TIGR02688 family)